MDSIPSSNTGPATNTSCQNCKRPATTKCQGCLAAPEYTTSSFISISYCDKACQIAHWPSHKTQCLVAQKRKKLLRAATLLKSTLLAHRECAFDVQLSKVDFRDGNLYLHQNTKRRKLHQFPDHLVTEKEYKEAALANNQCTLAMALLGPLTRALVSSVTTSTTIHDIVIRNPRFRTKLEPIPPHLANQFPPHTVLICTLKGGEKWVLYTTGCQYGFRDVLVPLDQYCKDKGCPKLLRSVGEPYTATETKDIDFFLTLPNMGSSKKELMTQRSVRVHFADFVKSQVEQHAPDFAKSMLWGSENEYQAKVDGFIMNLKKETREFLAHAK